MSSEVKPQRVPLIAFRSLWWAGTVAAGLAIIGNLIILFISQNLFKISFSIPPPPDTTEPFVITAVNVILDTVIMTASATIVFALLSRISSRPAPSFFILSAIILLFSLIFPALLPVDSSVKIALCLMHILTAIIAVRGLTRLRHQT